MNILHSRGPSRCGRPKDITKFEAVLEAANWHFLRFGFDGTSMEAVAAAAGVTKATVYAKFGSKGQLFLAVLEALRRGMPAPEELMSGPAANVPVRLRAIAQRLLDLTLSRTTLGIYRMLALPIESAPHLARVFWTRTADPYREAMREVLLDANRRGELIVSDAERAVSQFFGLVIGDPVLRMLQGGTPFSPRQRAEYAEAAVAVFLAGYTSSMESQSNPS
jgi:TetR/AcrR family transcriptional repressor of mexJK operon